MSIALGCAAGSDDASDSGDSAAGEPIVEDLTDSAAWRLLDTGDDLWPDHRPQDDWCFPDAMTVELEILEVETALCSYLNAGQPLLTGLAAGDTLQVLVYHASLTADEPAEAHVAIAIDGAVLWEEPAIPIPSPSEVYRADLPVEADAPAGAEVVLHLHNHGSNTWNLGHLRVERGR